ncbi:unnamed protein product (mitochondrion) [Plasmodiophora brassicae]|uniref:SHSP domain-containing protein n=1 Tax=Plasmodiophora brassicae TaxID=37360 RepID=A0A3P3Y0X8_PLABS|nr:unnamed protein product [Plasmodiophora brassicae]
MSLVPLEDPFATYYNEPSLDVGMPDTFMNEPFPTETHRYRHRYHHARRHHHRTRLTQLANLPRDAPSTQYGSSIMPLSSTLVEQDDQFILIVDVPGLTKDQIAVKVATDVLTINANPSPGVGTDLCKVDQEDVVWSERAITPSVRTIPIPLGADSDKTTEGRKEFPEPHRIEVQ